jgi:hypothetical protein
VFLVQCGKSSMNSRREVDIRDGQQKAISAFYYIDVDMFSESRNRLTRRDVRY